MQIRLRKAGQCFALAALVLFALTSATTVLFGQENVVQIDGSVSDQSSAAIPDATVTATNQETGRVFTTKTGGDGTYILRNLNPGRYKLQFEKAGFARVEFSDVLLLLGKPLKINAPMQVASTSEQVVVTEAAPLIDTTTTQVGHNIAQEEFDRLPKGRTFQNLAFASPAVLSGTIEGGIQVNGASGSENNFTVDGMTTSSLLQGQSRQNVAFEILQEVQVKTSGIEAQFGGATGGVISAVTRSGGNAFHGDIHYYYYGNHISAGPVKRLLMDPTDLITTSYVQDYKPVNDTHEAGYSLGGYFIKNKLFFFSAASPQFQNRDQNYLTADNKNITLYQSTTYWQAYNKINWEATSKLKVNAGFYWSPNHQEGVLPAYNKYGNQTTNTFASMAPNQNLGTFSPQSNYNATIDYIIDPTSMISIRGARFWDNYKSLGVLGQSAVEWGNSSQNIAAFNVPVPLQQAQGYDSIPRKQTTLYDLVTRTAVQIDYSKYLNFGGSHDIKVGLGRMKNVNKVDNSYPGGGYVTLWWDTAYQDIATGTQTRGTYGYYQVDDIGTKGSTGGTIDNIYIQDHWRPTKRLSLDLGIRFEKEVVPSFRRDIQDNAFQFGWGQKVAPRLGASFDVLGDGKLKVYGSWGMFYDWIKYELSRGTFGGDVWRTYYRSLDTLDVLSLGNGNLPGRNLWNGGASPFQDHRVPSFGTDTIDPNLKPFSSDLLNIGTEYQLSPKMVLSVRYTRNHLRQAIEDIGTLDSTGSEVYIYGNPGQGLGQMSSPSGIVPSFQLPRPKRVYNALEISFNRRFANRWFASGSYVWSKLYGNYSGIASTDEINPTSTGRVSTVAQQNTGTITRPGTSSSRYYDLDYLQWDAHGNYDIVGRLATDRPHVLKLYGSYSLPWKMFGKSAGSTEIGGFFYAESGAVMSTYVNTVSNAPVFANGRGDLGRTPVITQTDLVIAHTINIGEKKQLRFEFNAQNIFNQKTSTYTYNYYNRYRTLSSGINLKNVDFTQGYNYKAMIAATPDASKSYGALDPRYGKEDVFRLGFQGRIGVKFIF